ncbi:hypothetical protein CI109_106160 [Kwoniella shandongensis]|uniref:Uncharacterized protein n=1 Tax=Kwoniella shandongensis TaxID=1734106 RepID=A0A5M6BY73_9TREE|nr:uncharacterized protein CI109_003768 [Kwoniella shandongensis]KAA5527797.1 hypothetical protein CI109_003768 [Kwoniella shandongensis]
MPRLAPEYQYTNYKPRRFAYLRSFLPILSLILIFSFSLVSYSLLSHFRSPAAKQQIGWQAWDVVEVQNKVSTGVGVDVDLGEAGGGNSTEGEGDYVPSIPLDNWDPLALHTTGLTEIAVKPCYFPPYLFPSYCAPETTPELDKAKGKWVIVEKDLNLKTGLWYLNVYYRRTRRLDADLITDIRVVSEPPPDELKAELEGWVKAEGDLHNGVWPKLDEVRLWYKTRKQTWAWDDWKKRGITSNSISKDQKRADDINMRPSETDSVEEGTSENGAVEEVVSEPETEGETDWGYESDDIITEIDVVYGDDDPFYGFERIKGGKVTEAKAKKWESVDVAFRKGTPVAPKAKVPTFHNDGTFKVMQIADLHYSVGDGECRDTDKSPCIGDRDTATWLAEALDLEKPDLVVFSGDQLNGQMTSYDSRSVLAKFAKPVIDRQIPWCAVFGNHDGEIAEDTDVQMRMMQNMPYSLARAGPKAVDGVGNYYIKLHSSDASNVHLFTLYFLDSHAYQKKTLPWANADYDYIKTSQIDWYRNVSTSIKPIERPFQPDGVDDLGHIWSTRSRSRSSRLRPRAEKTLAKPNAMMWFHIPLPEAYNDADTAGFDGEVLDVGSQLDGEGSSKHNSGFFYNGIKAAFETEDTNNENGWYSTANKAEVKVLSHGHCHNTDRCRRTDGIWMCFDGGSSFSGYGQLGFDRRVRIYKLSDYGEKIETYKRLSGGEVIDNQVLVGGDAPEGWGEDQVR